MLHFDSCQIDSLLGNDKKRNRQISVFVKYFKNGML